jgi:ribosome-associated protein
MVDTSDADAPRPSRSAKKRHSLALQEAGEKLTRLAQAEIRRLGLPPELEEALIQYAGIRGREAKRRHIQFIGRLMRELTPELNGVLQLDDKRLIG